MKPFRILSIDGGGLRGIVPALVLKQLQAQLGNRPITDLFDLITGTSTGGLLAVALTASEDGLKPKYSVTEIEKLYTEQGPRIFPQRKGADRFWNSLKSWWDPEFSAAGLEQVLQELLGAHRLTDCLVPLLIPAYDLHNNKPLFFKSRHAFQDPEENACLFDVCRATSAGPTYLPAHSFRHAGRKVTCIDGGVFMNNPALGALAEISRHKDTPFYNRPDLKLENVHILSLGTGHYSGQVTHRQAAGWGKANWARPLIEVMMQGVNQTTDYEVRELLPAPNYLRLSIDIEHPQFADMADPRPETQRYLAEQVHRQLFGNRTLMQHLSDFSQHAGWSDVPTTAASF